jgi:hypothetical protein
MNFYNVHLSNVNNKHFQINLQLSKWLRRTQILQ